MAASQPISELEQANRVSSILEKALLSALLTKQIWQVAAPLLDRHLRDVPGIIRNLPGAKCQCECRGDVYPI